MRWTTTLLWIIPVLPVAAAGVIALLKQRRRTAAAVIAVTAQSVAFLLSGIAFAMALGLGESGEEAGREVWNFVWLTFGNTPLRLGIVLDPLSASMMLMVSLVGLLIFLFSVRYLAADANFTRFFGMISLFSGAMLGLVVGNSLLWLFVCWELVGVASYWLIGFWYENRAATAAAQKAFITTRIGDLGLFIGMLWLYAETGTLLFYDGGEGCIEAASLAPMAKQMTSLGLMVPTGIALLLFLGAMGKSGQFPLHTWLPDAMQGPTPVSALIHAATMVAAGVFLVARMFPLFELGSGGGSSTALIVVAWIGAVTAFFAAALAVAENDIKRILAYSTISQLGYMMLALGVAGVGVALFHLIAHAFFKALLFLGAGSVMAGCHEEHDIRRMGGLRRFMPLTFVTYGIGMMALSGFPLFFSGFWSKEAILHHAWEWPVSIGPFVLAIGGVFLTAFYMTRQMGYIFFGNYRHPEKSSPPCESPSLLTVPLFLLAAGSILPGVLATPVWPWFQSFLEGKEAVLDWSAVTFPKVYWLMAVSTALVLGGVGLGIRIYAVRWQKGAEEPDPLQFRMPRVFRSLRFGLGIDQFYNAVIVRAQDWLGLSANWMDRYLFNRVAIALSSVWLLLSHISHATDRFVLNGGFDAACSAVRKWAGDLSVGNNGQIQLYLRVIGLGMVVLLVLYAWMPL